MKKSVITRSRYDGPRQICVWKPMFDDRCHRNVTDIVTVNSQDNMLCEQHADAHVATYESEWARHPEMFED